MDVLPNPEKTNRKKMLGGFKGLAAAHKSTETAA